jgi:hypothetical protein
VFLEVEKAVTHTKWGRNRLQFMVSRVEVMRQRATEAKTGS